MSFSADEYPSLKGQPDGEWTVRSDCCGSGVSSVVDATAQSINSSYAKVMLELGPKSVVETAHELGVRAHFETRDGKTQYLPSYVLGSTTIPVIDVADSFSTFARNGVHLDPTLVTHVDDRHDNVLASYDSPRTQVLTPTQNARVVYALQQVIQRGTGTSADIGRPAAGKTGTVAVGDTGTGADLEPGTQNTDAWFTGFVPGFTASVWMGYQEGGRAMPGSFQGASYPTQIWKAFMNAALADVPPQDFPKVKDLSGGKFLTTWGGSSYLNPALSVKDYADGAGPKQPWEGQDQGQGQDQGGGQGGESTPATTAPPAGGGGGPPASTAPPATAPPSTAAPPAPTDPPASVPPAGPGDGGQSP
jgi:penicillin-binding protein 1A